MFTLLLVLPAWFLFRRLRHPEALSCASPRRLALQPYSLSTSEMHALPHPAALLSPSQAFPPIPHPLGFLSVRSTYLLTAAFSKDTLESLLSFRFLSQDDMGFTPTVTAPQQRCSSLSSLGAGRSPLRACLPRSPTGPSLADRFVLSPRGSPAHQAPGPCRSPLQTQRAAPGR
ncbi:hypothetical protein JB92DRAFT_414458 [Gautieria morchelliformis]|nr:hypothetical protein JB92DRAFT_414458 [Gautieria morchelliformis]